MRHTLYYAYFASSIQAGRELKILYLKGVHKKEGIVRKYFDLKIIVLSWTVLNLEHSFGTCFHLIKTHYNPAGFFWHPAFICEEHKPNREISWNRSRFANVYQIYCTSLSRWLFFFCTLFLAKYLHNAYLCILCI